MGRRQALSKRGHPPVDLLRFGGTWWTMVAVSSSSLLLWTFISVLQAMTTEPGVQLITDSDMRPFWPFLGLPGEDAEWLLTRLGGCCWKNFWEQHL